MAVCTSKTKTLTTAKEPVQCKLVTDDALLEQVTVRLSNTLTESSLAIEIHTVYGRTTGNRQSR